MNIVHKILLGACLLFTGNIYSQDNCPCCNDLHKQFDFWLGNWETYANGQLAGTNRILKLQDSCVLQENWQSAGSTFSGTSYNFYDPADEMWHQVWLDNQGWVLKLKGGLLDGNMVLRSDQMTNPKGDPVFHRITWTPNQDGTVTQHWESSPDGKGEWKTVFKGEYRKKGS